LRWKRPERAAKRKSYHEWYYENVKRPRTGRSKRGARWSLPEKQVRKIVEACCNASEVIFFDRKTLGGRLELDVFNPVRRWAIDIRGAYHYKPIHGLGHLRMVRRWDKRKSALCRKLGIRLIVMRTIRNAGFSPRTLKRLQKKLELV